MSTNPMDRAASREVRAYDRAMLRAQFASLFWAAILERRKAGKFTLAALAKALGKNKGEVSRWFSGDAPNWTIGTVAEIAHALDLEIHLEARDRSTGMTLTASGPKVGAETPDGAKKNDMAASAPSGSASPPIRPSRQHLLS